MPQGYGIRKGKAGLIPWSHVEERMSGARNYWVCTTTNQGHPHAMPVWGVWIERKFYFSTDRKSRKSRNLMRQPAIAVHLESGDDVVILEGTVSEVTKAPLVAAVDDAFGAKYGMRLATIPGDVAIYGVAPGTIFAWREKDFPVSATRWLIPR